MVQFVQFQNVPDSRWWPGPLEGSSRFSQPGNESSRFFPGKFQGKSYLLPDSCAHSIIDNHCSWHLQYIVLLQLNNSDTAKVAGKIWIRIWNGKASLKLLISKLVKCVLRISTLPKPNKECSMACDSYRGILYLGRKIEFWQKCIGNELSRQAQFS